jgi:Protein of unknown function (DUF3618)
LIEDSHIDRIERDLDDTRSRIDTTVRALQHKLAPGEMVEQAMTYFREGGGVEFQRSLVRTVRDNPMPVALIGLGVGWLTLSIARQGFDKGSNDWRGRPWMRDDRFGGGTDYDLYGRGGGGGTPARGFGHESETLPHQPMPYEAAAYDDLATKAQEAGGRVQREAHDTDETFQDRVYAARGSVLGVARKAGEAATSFRDRVEAAFTAAAERVRQAATDVGGSATSIAGHGQTVAGRLYEYGSSATAGLRDRAGQARDLGSRTVDYMQEQPLLLGALGVAVGAMIGLLVPPSRYERELAGSVRDNLGEIAREAMQEAGRRVTRVADTVVDTARDSARREGFAGVDAPNLASAAGEQVTDVASRVRHVVEETATAGREALQRELSGNEPSDEQSKPGGAQDIPWSHTKPITGA